MPLTVSHPIAVLPLKNTKLIFSALVIGSMSPDFLYFINFAPKGKYGHTVEGLFLFCLPVGIIVLWIFHHIMKRPLVQFFPIDHQKKLTHYAGDFKFGGFSRFILICLSILIGAITHIVWDGFTHEKGWVVEQVPPLTMTLISTPYGDFKIYKFLQYLGHLFGFPLLIYFYYKWYEAAPSMDLSIIQAPSRRIKLLIMGLIISGSFLFALYYGIDYKTFSGSLTKLYKPIGQVTVLSINLSFMGVLLYCIYWNYRYRSL